VGIAVTQCTDRWLRLVIDGLFSRRLSSNRTRPGAAVSRRVVGSSPTSGAKLRNEIEAAANWPPLFV